jgi:hypothetical protein
LTTLEQLLYFHFVWDKNDKKREVKRERERVKKWWEYVRERERVIHKVVSNGCTNIIYLFILFVYDTLDF